MNLHYLNNCFKWNIESQEWEEKYLYSSQLHDLLFSHTKNIKKDICNIFMYGEDYYMFPMHPNFCFDEVLSGGASLKYCLSERYKEYCIINKKLNKNTSKSLSEKLANSIKSLIKLKI